MSRRLSIRIHGVRYRLRFVNGPRDRLLKGKLAGEVFYGEAPGVPVIKIDETRQIDEQRETVLHEFLHIASQECGLEPVVSEPMTVALARYLYGILRDNPRVALWIIGQNE